MNLNPYFPLLRVTSVSHHAGLRSAGARIQDPYMLGKSCAFEFIPNPVIFAWRLEIPVSNTPVKFYTSALACFPELIATLKLNNSSQIVGFYKEFSCCNVSSWTVARVGVPCSIRGSRRYNPMRPPVAGPPVAVRVFLRDF